MRYAIVIMLSLISANASMAQSLKKYAIGASGSSAYLFCDPGKFDVAKSPDSSDVYTGECTNDDVTYGVICVKLREKINDMETSESTLISYLDYLKGSLKITGSAGYGKGHRLKDREDTRGVIDYWKDKDATNWKVKGWTDGKYIAVLYVSSAKEVPETKANVFLNSLVLP